MSRRYYPVPGCPGLYVYRFGKRWEVTSKDTPLPKVAWSAMVEANDGCNWARKRDAIRDIQIAYDFHKHLADGEAK